MVSIVCHSTFASIYCFTRHPPSVAVREHLKHPYKVKVLSFKSVSHVINQKDDTLSDCLLETSFATRKTFKVGDLSISC